MIPETPAIPSNATVVLLHGLARSARSMAPLAAYLRRHGYRVLNINYPSREYAIPALALKVREAILQQVEATATLHVVTHSMGGILLRYLQRYAPLPHLGRVVMLSPPNHGSEVVDRMANTCLFNWINGPAGRQLGTGDTSIVTQLGPIDFELGIITGDRSINWINSLMIPGPDDGKVSVASAQLEGMKDFRVVHATHPLIMRKAIVQQYCLHFLRTGQFATPG